MDIIPNQSSVDPKAYPVFAVNNGVVVYVKLNGGLTTGYGYTVIVDHENGIYTLYAHLGFDFSNGLAVYFGQRVTTGQTIGYMAVPPKESTGNAAKTSDAIQLHFEEFVAPSQRKFDSIRTIKMGGVILNPTSDLLDQGYKTSAPLPCQSPAPPTALTATIN